jgi:hypothetical protein
MQNGGRLSAAKRRLFAELDDAEVRAMQEAVRNSTARAGVSLPFRAPDL